jgi:hypothetical protein
MNKLSPSRDGEEHFKRRPRALEIARAVLESPACTASDLEAKGVVGDPANALRALRKMRDDGILEEVPERRGSQTISRWTVSAGWRKWLATAQPEEAPEVGVLADGDRLLAVSGGEAEVMFEVLSDLGLREELAWVAPLTGSMHCLLSFRGPEASRAVRRTRARLRRDGFDVADGLVDERLSREQVRGWVAGVADQRPSHVLEDIDLSASTEGREEKRGRAS